MKTLSSISLSISISMALLIASPLNALAEKAMEHKEGDHMSMSKSESIALTDGEVKKLDLEAGKVTIKHGAIKHLDMPSMTMVFTAKDKAILTKLKVGDQIKFGVTNESGKYFLTEIQVVR